MARGKHSSATAHRRMTAAEADVKWLRAALRKEEREHEVTRRVAERAEGLEELTRSLRMDLELATCDEIKKLTDERRAIKEENKRMKLALKDRDTVIRIAGHALADILSVSSTDGLQFLVNACPGDLQRDVFGGRTIVSTHEEHQLVSRSQASGHRLLAARGRSWKTELDDRASQIRDYSSSRSEALATAIHRDAGDGQ